MKWTNDRSKNVDDRRGSGGGRGMLVGGGLGSLIIVAIIFFLGGDPSSVLNNAAGIASQQTEQSELTPEDLKVREFIQMLAAENEQTWSKIFSENGIDFSPEKVVLFQNITSSGCGTAQSAMGPFYCSADQTIYMDMSFFNELRDRFGAKTGDFTVA